MTDFNFASDYMHVIRKAYRLTLAQMGEALGISTAYVHAIEQKREPLTDNVRKKLIEVFELTPQKLKQIERDYRKYTFKGR